VTWLSRRLHEWLLQLAPRREVFQTGNSVARPELGRVYKKSPVFPSDPESFLSQPEPDFNPSVILFWNIFPAGVRKTFIEVFTGGITFPDKRLMKTEWKSSLTVRLPIIGGFSTIPFLFLDGNSIFPGYLDGNLFFRLKMPRFNVRRQPTAECA